MVEVILHRAARTADTQTFGKQDPYAAAELRPQEGNSSNAPDESAEADTRPRTLPCEGGGTEPRWDASHNHTLVLPLSSAPAAKELSLTLWNDNFLADDLIGTASTPLDSIKVGSSRAQWLKLDTGGTLNCTICRRRVGADRERPNALRSLREAGALVLRANRIRRWVAPPPSENDLM